MRVQKIWSVVGGGWNEGMESGIKKYENKMEENEVEKEGSEERVCNEEWVVEGGRRVRTNG